MYDEFERALTGARGRRGLSPLGWFAAAIGLVMLVGAVGVGYAVTRVAARARHLAQEIGGTPGVVAARMMSRLDRSASLATLDPEAGLTFLRGLDPGNPSDALVHRLAGNELDLSEDVQAVPNTPRDRDQTSMTIHSDDGDVDIQLTRGKDGGSLAVSSKDGHVLFDLARSSTGGTLTIDSDDGHARIDLMRGDGGGQLVIRSDDQTVELGLGASSRGAPAWVPRPAGMPETSTPVFSLSTGEAVLGALSWEDDGSPGELLTSFRETLEDDGYEVQVEHRRSGPDHDEASLWARREADGRMVFLLARRTDGRTRDVLGYGRGDRRDR